MTTRGGLAGVHFRQAFGFISLFALAALLPTALSEPQGGRSNGKPGVLVAVDAHNGKREWSVTRGEGHGSSLSTWFATDDIVVASEAACFSQDRQYQQGDQSIVAFDADDGEERWRVSDVDPVPSAFAATFALSSGSRRGPVVPVFEARAAREFALSGVPPTEIQGLDVESGRRVWRRDPDGLVPWAAEGASLLLGTAPDPRYPAFVREIEVHAVNLRTGQPRWSTSLGVARGIDGIALGSDTISVMFDRSYDPTQPDLSRVVSLDSKDGKRLAELPPVRWTSIGVGGEQIVGSDAGGSQAVDAANGQVAWFAEGQLSGAPGIDVTPLLLGGFDDAVLRAVDTTSGTERWRVPADHGFHGVDRTGTIMAIGANKKISGVAVESGRLLWQRALPKSAAGFVAGGDRIYFSGGCPTTTAD